MVSHGDANVDNNTDDMIRLTKNYDFKYQQEMATFTPPLMSLHQSLVTCGVKNGDKFDKKTAAERITEEVFDDIFYLIIDICCTCP